MACKRMACMTFRRSILYSHEQKFPEKAKRIYAHKEAFCHAAIPFSCKYTKQENETLLWCEQWQFQCLPRVWTFNWNWKGQGQHPCKRKIKFLEWIHICCNISKLLLWLARHFPFHVTPALGIHEICTALNLRIGVAIHWWFIDNAWEFSGYSLNWFVSPSTCLDENIKNMGVWSITIYNADSNHNELPQIRQRVVSGQWVQPFVSSLHMPRRKHQEHGSLERSK